MSLNRRKKTIAARLLAADAVRALIAAPGAGLAIRVFYCLATVVTSAAQQVDVGVAAGTVAQQFMSLPASAVLPVEFRSEEGFVLPANTALSADPALAGPAVQFFIEYTIESA